jgi:hypothetical protein
VWFLIPTGYLLICFVGRGNWVFRRHVLESPIFHPHACRRTLYIAKSAYGGHGGSRGSRHRRSSGGTTETPSGLRASLAIVVACKLSQRGANRGGPRGSESGNRRSRKNIFLTESGNRKGGTKSRNQGIRSWEQSPDLPLTRHQGHESHDGRAAAVIRAEGAENLAVPLHNMAGIT